MLQTVGGRLDWEGHNPEFICRIDPNAAPLEPELADDDGWTTFLLPAPADPGTPDPVINAIAAGFQPPEAVHDFKSLNQENLATVYPPGAQVDPAAVDGPYYSKEMAEWATCCEHFSSP